METPSRTKLSILIFLLLTFAISSVSYYVFITQHSATVQGGIFVLILMWSPGVAALVTRLIFQRNLRGQGWGWGKWKYQIASWWIPAAYAAAVYVPVWLAGFTMFHPAEAAARHGVTQWAIWQSILGQFLYLATVGVLFGCLSAAGEELGWRGFLVPQLAKLTSYSRVSLVSGVVWALWHYPLILFADDVRGGDPLWYSVLCFTVMVIGISFLFAWMRLKSGSVWTGVFLHSAHNTIIQGFFDPATVKMPLTAYLTTEFGAGLAAMALVLAIIFYRMRNALPSQVMVSMAPDTSFTDTGSRH